MSTDLDPATVLEEAADLLLIRGVRRDGTAGSDDGGPLCVLGAIHVVTNEDGAAIDLAFDTFREHRFPGSRMCTVVFNWNDSTDDDFEVIDTLRHVAKDLRNAALVTA